jgi:hypothetical protein
LLGGRPDLAGGLVAELRCNVPRRSHAADRQVFSLEAVREGRAYHEALYRKPE